MQAFRNGNLYHIERIVAAHEQNAARDCRTDVISVLRATCNCFAFHTERNQVYGRKMLERVQAEQIRRFKAINIFRRHEAFYMAYPEKLRDENLLTPEEYAVFERMWNEINHDTKSAPYFDATTLEFDPGVYHLEFHLKAESVLDLGGLFSISWFDLKNRESEEAAKAFFSSGERRECIKVWELPGIDIAF